jgi:hypothetical protein
MFELKKYTSIWGSAKPRAGGRGQKAKYSHTDFSDLVLVLDEGTTKVKVQKKDGFPVWIGKFFLRTEVLGDGKTEFRYEQIITTVKSLVSKVQGQLTQAEQTEINSALYHIQQLIDKDTHS